MFSSVFELIFPKRCLGCSKSGTYLCPNCYQTVNFNPTQRCAVCNSNSTTGATHPRCKRKWTIDGVWAAAANQELLRKIVHRWKYGYSSQLTSILAQIIAEHLPPTFLDFDIIAPVPLHPTRLRWRGYNQAEKLSQELLKKLGRRHFDPENDPPAGGEDRRRNLMRPKSQVKDFSSSRLSPLRVEMTLLPELLFRTRQNTPQMQIKDRETRLKNLKNTFKLNNRSGLVISTLRDRRSTGGEISRFIKNKNILLIDDITTTGTTLRQAALPLKRAGAQRVWGVVVAR